MADVPTPPPEPIGSALRRLREAKGLTLEDLAYRAKTRMRELGKDGGTTGHLGQIERGEQKAAPSVALMEILADELGVPPATFHEYRLGRARELLDERVVGLEQALATLSQVEEALMRSARSRAANAGARPTQGHQPNRGASPGREIQRVALRPGGGQP
jgi:transcriptional regulator with XRE-family HTH domain